MFISRTIKSGVKSGVLAGVFRRISKDDKRGDGHAYSVKVCRFYGSTASLGACSGRQTSASRS